MSEETFGLVLDAFALGYARLAAERPGPLNVGAALLWSHIRLAPASPVQGVTA
jgi:hypothetical protein